ncbi:MAG: phospholipase, partial [Rhizobiales bacterium]|nr:phospholipase [Hyphomicrobiales bacterium]
RANSPAGIVAYSGLLAGPEHLADEITTRPPVLIAHGTHDEVVPYAMMGAAQKALEGVGIKVANHSAQGVGHGIDAAGMALGLAHCKSVFNIS